MMGSNEEASSSVTRVLSPPPTVPNSILESCRNIEVDNGIVTEGELYRHAKNYKDGYQSVEFFPQEKKAALRVQALEMQQGLAALLERIQAVQAENNKLEDENKFLQDYIGNLMSTGNLLGKKK